MRDPNNEKRWQITLASETAKDTVLSKGMDGNGDHYECTALFGFRPDGAANPPAFVTAKMPYDMPDATIKSILTKYGQVTRVHRRLYAFAPAIETGLRMFTIATPPDLSLEHVK